MMSNVIRTAPLAHRTKFDICADIARILGVPAPRESRGSSIDSPFLDTMHRKLFGSASGAPTTYRKADRLLSQLGLVYDPWWDTSESRDKGGGTVTTRTFSRVLVALSGQPRCFLVPADRAGAPIETEGERSPARNAFAEAGPGSLVLTVREVRGEEIDVVGAAEVLTMTPGWTRPWKTVFSPVRKFDEPLRIAVSGLKKGRTIEVEPAAFERIVAAAGSGPETMTDTAQSDSVRHRGGAAATAAVATAERIVQSYSVEQLPHHQLRVPVPVDDVDIADGEPAEYVEGQSLASEGGLKATDGRVADIQHVDRALASMIEQRAVAIAVRALTNSGWTLARDCQRDGVGYDLLFVQPERELHVEVKGIQGTEPIFNLTSKEWWRATTDRDWFVVAVTSALSPTAPTVRLFTRDKVVAARRKVLSYRVWL